MDNLGIQIYSPTRHGEAANFDEAFGQLVDRYEKKGMIQREPGAPAPSPVPGQQRGGGSTITRAQFDSLPPASRAKFMSEGGRINDVSGTPAPAPAPAALQASSKTMTRAQFDVTPPPQVAAFFKTGGRIVD